MSDRIKNIAVTLVMTVCIFGAAIACWVKKPGEISESERRKLAQFPEITEEALLSGSFMEDFEKYTLDQFPLRDDVRRLKAIAQFQLFLQKDNNNIYVVNGSAASLEYPLRESSVENAVAKFQSLYDKYMAGKDMDVYYAIIPDKNYYMAAQNGYPAMNYDRMVEIMRQCDSFMKYIDLFDCLEISDYYATDSHWRQEHLEKVVNRIAEQMGIRERLPENLASYTVKQQDRFYGVYYGQSALPLPSETIYYLTNDILEQCTVYNFETGKTGGIYDMEKAESRDRYELFLSGAAALLTVENPNATTDKELIVFRDSFGSSLTPLLIGAYAKVTLVDIRYVTSDYLGGLMEFTNQDVLFIYNTLVLNSSTMLR